MLAVIEKEIKALKWKPWYRQAGRAIDIRGNCSPWARKPGREMRRQVDLRAVCQDDTIEFADRGWREAPHRARVSGSWLE
ncbi:MAG: hypothetical protein WBE80_02825 [Methylocella sp.]